MTDSHDAYARRRAAVLEALGDDAVLLLAAHPELTIGRDTQLRYVVGSRAAATSLAENYVGYDDA